MTEEELARPCWICSNKRGRFVMVADPGGQTHHWVEIAPIHNTDENCGHREPELRVARNAFRRKPAASEVLYHPISPVRVA